MKSSSTIVYAVNDFEKKEFDLYNADEILSCEKYSDIANVLDKALKSPRNSIVKNLLIAAKKA